MSTLEQRSREIGRRLEGVDARSAAMVQAFEACLRYHRETLDNDATQAINGYIAGQHARFMQYSQLVIGLGYGGFLTMWVTSYSRLSPTIFAVSGALMLCSLLIYIAGELATLHLVHQVHAEASKLPDGLPMHARAKLKFCEDRFTSWNARWNRRLF